jgi:multicomponent Na+:H+ antiporter subunit D
MLINANGLIGSIYHFLSHAIVKGGLFLVAGIIFYNFTNTKIEITNGLFKKMPFTSIGFLIFALSMIGIPATSGFISKWYLVMGAIETGNWIGVTVILLSSLLTAIYFWRVVDRIFFKAPDDDVKFNEPISMILPTYILAGCSIYFGLFPHQLVNYAQKAVLLLMETIK